LTLGVRKLPGSESDFILLGLQVHDLLEDTTSYRGLDFTMEENVVDLPDPVLFDEASRERCRRFFDAFEAVAERIDKSFGGYLGKFKKGGSYGYLKKYREWVAGQEATDDSLEERHTKASKSSAASDAALSSSQEDNDEKEDAHEHHHASSSSSSSASSSASTLASLPAATLAEAQRVTVALIEVAQSSTAQSSATAAAFSRGTMPVDHPTTGGKTPKRVSVVYGRPEVADFDPNEPSSL